MRYMPSTVKFSQEAEATHNIYLARGRDRAGNHYADPTKTYGDLLTLRRSRNGH
jgi:hypothetical protein